VAARFAEEVQEENGRTKEGAAAFSLSLFPDGRPYELVRGWHVATPLASRRRLRDMRYTVGFHG